MPVWPVAMHTDTDTPPIACSEAIFPPFDFPAEIHNENLHYTCLAIGFLLDSNNGYFNQGVNNPETRAETYGKYITERLLGYDPWFRLYLCGHMEISST